MRKLPTHPNFSTAFRYILTLLLFIFIKKPHNGAFDASILG